MTTLNSKTIISYSGGSAGDMFTLSCNGEKIDSLTEIWVSQPATLKNYEHQLKMGQPANLAEELHKMPYQYVNTHMLDEVVGKEAIVYNIVMADKDVQLKTVYRQMQLQKLRIRIDLNPHSWYYTIKAYCDANDYQSAAEYWLDKAKDYWIDRMNYRLGFSAANFLNFDKLYTESFVDDLEKQGWIHNLQVLEHNHVLWLKKNSEFTKEKTLKIMAQKISTMDWQKQEGWIVFNSN